jgi:hypothetical protein
MAESTCPLCRAERITRWYFESELCWIADCQICSTPMVVWRQHGMPDEKTRAAMLEQLNAVAAQEYPEGFWLDPVMRQIPDHFHCHARPKDGFFGPRKEMPSP